MAPVAYHPFNDIPAFIMPSSTTNTQLTEVECATLEAVTSTLRTCNAHLGGSAIGTGFRHAARYHLRKRAPEAVAKKLTCGRSTPTITAAALSNDEDYDTSVLEPGCSAMIEDPFYVVDLGIVASQLARWRAAFPRVLPYYAVKCNPDPVIVRMLASLGCNFDCASRGEIEIVQQIASELPSEIRRPDIIFANPCKGRGHIIDAVCRGVKMTTFDNIAEIHKCASVSKHIQLILRIITDDSGSQCRLSSKFGAPRQHWKQLLGEAKKAGLQVVGVSFHVGSGCRDATRYEMALRDAKELFELAEKEYGFKMTILDIGGGFPGETHSLWNPATAFGDPTADTRGHRRKPTMLQDIPTIQESGIDDLDEDPLDEEDDDDEIEGIDHKESAEEKETQLMYFNEIAEAVAPMLDEMFPATSGVKIIAEPGRYLVAAAATLVTSVVSVRNNLTDNRITAEGISDKMASENVFLITRDEEDEIVQETAQALKREDNSIMETLVEELTDYSLRYARANLSQQEVDVYLDNIKTTDAEDILAEALDVVAEEEDDQEKEDAVEMTHTVEGMQAGIVVGCADVFDDEASAISARRLRAESFGDASKLSDGNAVDIPFVLAAAGEAAVSGIVRQAIADSVQPLQDDFAYYINDGVYGAFNNLLFDHATVRPRKLRHALSSKHQIIEVVHGEGKDALRTLEVVDEVEEEPRQDEILYPSTVFGPTCDSMDVLSRGVLLPKMNVGDWMYFQNMGAYTSAAASTFNGFPTTEKFYVCSVPSHHFKKLVADGRVNVDTENCEEKKDDI